MDWRKTAWRSALAAGIAAALASVLLVGYAWWLWPQTPGPRQLERADAARPSVLLTADGKTLATFGRTHKDPITLDEVPPQLLQALLATEDRRFHQHHGVDWRRTVVAALRTLAGDTQGGSTITQQLARNLFPEQIGRSRSLDRKLKEIITALRIERSFSKRQILESYLNNAAFLYNVVGIEMAARTYFDKPARELSLVESATLVGMLKGTSSYNPVSRPARAKARRNLVLRQMAQQGWLDEEQLRAASEQPLQVRLNLQAGPGNLAPHFVQRARRWLIDWAEENDVDLHADGLVVHTTLDSRLQEAATRAVATHGQALQAVADVEWSRAEPPLAATSTDAYRRQQPRLPAFAHFWRSRPELLAAFVKESPEYRQALASHGPQEALRRLLADSAWLTTLQQTKTRLEAGLVAVDPASGAILAWVGSRDFDQDQFDHVAQARRQPGSTFKPFVYGAALERGIAADASYVNRAVEVPLADGQTWRPTDMAAPDDQPMTLRDGLVHSKNTITVQVSQQVGIERVARLAQDMGIDQSPLDLVPSLALGTSPVSLLELANAYATIAAGGQHREPLLIQRISDRNGRLLATFQAPTRRVMSEGSAVELIDMMRGVVDRGTGTAVRSRFGIRADVAGKTGTTQNNTDAWFILMHPRLVAGAWVGFNDGRVTLRSNHWGQGGHSAVLPVGEFFRSALGSGAIDAKARFAPPRRPPAPPPPAAAPAASVAPAGANSADNAAPPAADPADTPAAPEHTTTEPAPATLTASDLERVLAPRP